MRTDGRTDMTKLIVDFWYLANGPKSRNFLRGVVLIVGKFFYCRRKFVEFIHDYPVLWTRSSFWLFPSICLVSHTYWRGLKLSIASRSSLSGFSKSAKTMAAASLVSARLTWPRDRASWRTVFSCSCDVVLDVFRRTDITSSEKPCRQTKSSSHCVIGYVYGRLNEWTARTRSRDQPLLVDAIVDSFPANNQYRLPMTTTFI